MILSIVITTRNRYQDLIGCLKSLQMSSLPKHTELIVVDDSSTDETKDITTGDLKAYIAHVTVLHQRKQMMMVKSRNIGAKKARGKYILFVDDDNLVDPKMVSKLIYFAEKYPDYGIIGPSMSYANGKKYLDFQTINMFTGKTTGHINETNHKVSNSDGVPNVFMIRAEVFAKCGYFDEGLVQTFTEPDFALHAKRSGYGCGIVSGAVTYHQTNKNDDLKPRGMGGMFEQKAYCLMRNRTVIVARYGSFIQKIIYALIFSWFWPLTYSLLVLREFRFDLIKLYWLGFADGIEYLLTGKLNWSYIKR